MSRRIRIARFLATIMAVGFIVLASGCATEDEIFKLRVEVKEAKGAADRADQAANIADSKANAFLQTRPSIPPRRPVPAAEQTPRRELTWNR